MMIIEIGDSVGLSNQFISPAPVSGLNTVVSTPLGCSKIRHTIATTINEGNTGTYAKATDQVQCHYEGTLIDGTLFDSSIKRGQPATFGVNQVIPGWVEALQLMPEGAKWKLYIPSDLAYGAQGAGEMIPPHSTLVFEVELQKILSK